MQLGGVQKLPIKDGKAHKKNNIKFLNIPWTAGQYALDARPASRQKCQLFYSKQQEIHGTPAGGPLFVRRVFQGHPANVPRILLSLCAFFFPDPIHRECTLWQWHTIAFRFFLWKHRKDRSALLGELSGTPTLTYKANI